MRSLINVWVKSFVTRFYEAHMLAFLFFTLAMFGMADGGTIVQIHYYILYNAFSSLPALFWLLLVLLVYGLNGLRYMLNTLNNDEFAFIYTSNTAPFNDLAVTVFWCVVLINAPIVTYGCIGIAIAISKNLLLMAFAGALGIMAINTFVTCCVLYKLISTHKKPLLNISNALPRVSTRRTMLSIVLGYLTNSNKLAFIATKVFSCAVLYAAHYEWHSFNYDIRWMQVAMSLSIPAQGVLIYQIWKFETTQLRFTRNFPVSTGKRYTQMLAMVIILLLPEAILLASYCYQYNILWQWPVYMVYAVSLPMLVYAMLFTHGFNQETYGGFLFGVALATFFVTLFGFTWLLAILFMAVSYLVYREAYYNFEEEMK